MKLGKLSASLLVGSSLLLLVGCGANQANSSSKNAAATTTQVHHARHQDQVVGTFIDKDDGAAILLRSDGTGQYVYADSGEPDTNDQLTWQKDGDHYTVNLKDSNVTSPLTATMVNGELTLTGDDNWNTEHFKKTAKKVDLNQFLADQPKSQGTAATTNTGATSNGSGDQDSSNSNDGNTKDFTDSYGKHHVEMSGNTDAEGNQMGVDYVTGPDGVQRVMQYNAGHPEDY